MLTSISDRSILRWLQDFPQDVSQLEERARSASLCDAAITHFKLPAGYENVIKWRLNHLQKSGALVIVDGILQVSPTTAKALNNKPTRRPASLARRQEMGEVVGDVIYTSSPRSQTAEGDCAQFGFAGEGCRSGDEWRLTLAALVARDCQVVEVPYGSEKDLQKLLASVMA